MFINLSKCRRHIRWWCDGAAAQLRHSSRKQAKKAPGPTTMAPAAAAPRHAHGVPAMPRAAALSRSSHHITHPRHAHKRGAGKHIPYTSATGAAPSHRLPARCPAPPLTCPIPQKQCDTVSCVAHTCWRQESPSPPFFKHTGRQRQSGGPLLLLLEPGTAVKCTIVTGKASGKKERAGQNSRLPGGTAAAALRTAAAPPRRRAARTRSRAHRDAIGAKRGSAVEGWGFTQRQPKAVAAACTQDIRTEWYVGQNFLLRSSKPP